MRFAFIIIQILCLLVAITVAQAQPAPELSTRVDQESSYYSRQAAKIEQSQAYTVRPNFPFTSVSLRIDSDAVFEGAYVVHQQDTFYLRADEHTPLDISSRRSGLIVFDQTIEELLFYPATIRGSVSFSFFNAQGEKKSLSQSLRTASLAQTTACDEPAFVPVETWRAGLPPPSYSRTITSVEHVIVHHSATYNDLTNYENVVRNIYLFHTQDRGWSDIGYNYLIAQDGTIFEGRSAGADTEENDNVMGAHFCGQNSRTMGVCLLGSYSTAEPTDTAIASLVKLTAWKLAKEGLEPDGERSHPANPALPTIAGHRNGCATECPGDNVYARLDEIRASVEDYTARGCTETPLALRVYPVPAARTLTIALPDSLQVEAMAVYDLAGRTWEVPLTEAPRVGSFTLNTDGLVAGVYVLHLEGPGWKEQRKILVE